MSLVGTLGVGIGVGMAVLLLAFYFYVYRRNRREASGGLATRSRLVCPKCGETFDYDYVPGASLTSLRLGTSRYMACPKCRQWSTFDLASTRVTAPPPPTP